MQQRLHAYTVSVWAIPRSLATTRGVSIDVLSWRYLDVSVPSVGSDYVGNPVLPGLGFPIRKSRGQTLVCQLTQAYRRLLRPSSPPNAKAFTVCPSIIHTKTINLRIDDEISLICRHCVYHHSYAQFKERNRPRWSTRLRPGSVVEKQTATSLFTSHVPHSEEWRIGSLKEVIQPQVPLRLPCYDFTPIIGKTVGASFPRVRLATSGPANFRGVTGGVYKARERIHRGMLIRDY
jgi:hypothetical protein